MEAYEMLRELAEAVGSVRIEDYDLILEMRNGRPVWLVIPAMSTAAMGSAPIFSSENFDKALETLLDTLLEEVEAGVRGTARGAGTMRGDR